MLNPEQIAKKVDRLISRSTDRDRRMSDVLAVRQGNMQDVFFSQFNDEYPKPLIANTIDVAARDLAEVTAPIPAVNCSSTNMNSEKDRKFADKRTRIANHYINKSDLQIQMYPGSDWYYTYGFAAGIVEIDFETNNPRIRLLNPFGLYYDKDRFGNVTCIAQVTLTDSDTIVSQYPEYYNRVINKYGHKTSVKMIRYHDKDQDTIYLPDLDNLILSSTPNLIGRVCADIAERPTLDGETRGQFDDVIPVQLAKAKFALLQLEAAKKSVEAPIAIPNDVTEFALGPDALLRSNTPERIRRVPIELPNGVFAETQNLERELRNGARYPEGRSGNIDASIVTGRGVQALMGGFDSQIKAAQAVFARFFINLIGIAFEIDEKIFGDTEKIIRGTDDGTPYEIKYRPKKDIAGDYSVDVQYGLMAGLDPNRAAIFGLQLRGDKLISRDFLRRNLPFSINVTQEEQRIDVEELRDTLRTAVAQYANAIPMIATQGGDPTEAVQRLATIINGRQKGESLETLVEKAFAPKEQPAATAMAPGASQPSPEMGMVPGAAPAAGSQMVAGPGQFSRRTDLAQGSNPQMSQLLAALTGAA